MATYRGGESRELGEASTEGRLRDNSSPFLPWCPQPNRGSFWGWVRSSFHMPEKTLPYPLKKTYARAGRFRKGPALGDLGERKAVRVVALSGFLVLGQDVRGSGIWKDLMREIRGMDTSHSLWAYIEHDLVKKTGAHRHLWGGLVDAQELPFPLHTDSVT